VRASRDGGSVRISGWGSGSDAPRFSDRVRPDTFVAATAASSAAFAMSGRGARDVQVVEIHDAFSPFELMNLEAMGSSRRATRGARSRAANSAWAAASRSTLRGMKARGHPIGVCMGSRRHSMLPN
jgi:acetyl-CoA acetyltransferase